MEIKTISLIGSGKVATNLAISLVEKDIEIVGIYSKNLSHAVVLAYQIDSVAIEKIADLPVSDLVLICVPDAVIPEIVNQLSSSQKIAYTAGSVELSTFDNPNIGVFYPLQTFSEGRILDLFHVPFHIEASDSYFQQSLFDLAYKISQSVQITTSNQRKHLHLAAVFANNFTNALWEIAKQHCEAHNLDFKQLSPLILETVSKMLILGPEKSQTGPALRRDDSTLELHRKLVDPSYLELYNILTSTIQKNHNA